MYIKTLTVSEINSYIKKVIDNDFILGNSSIKGEISNFKRHSSGHIYFSLKDETSKISCVMFKSFGEKLKFEPKDGMKVIVYGRISVYHKEGSYQIYCESMEPQGVGELYKAFEALKEKLSGEGLFKEEYKKTIPKYPKKIGVITSPTGAAIRDIINVIKRRNSFIDIIIYPALVQGANAKYDIVKGIEKLNTIGDIDTIIIGRGGGSIEELWPFNEEEVARAVFKSKKPIITGVGHETDFTIVDFVSDRRAPTPSAAAEIAVTSYKECIYNIESLKKTLTVEMDMCIKEKKKQLILKEHILKLNSPKNFIVNSYRDVDILRNKIINKITIDIEKNKSNVRNIYDKLNSLNPLSVLNKGYSIIQDSHGNVIDNIENLKKSDNIEVTLKDGKGKFYIRGEE